MRPPEVKAVAALFPTSHHISKTVARFRGTKRGRRTAILSRGCEA
jgi:hypothetical protein